MAVLIDKSAALSEFTVVKYFMLYSAPLNISEAILIAGQICVMGVQFDCRKHDWMSWT